MLFSTLFLALLTSVSAKQSPPTGATPINDPVTIFIPPKNYESPGVGSGRCVQLANGELLTTWANSGPKDSIKYSPIYVSQDNGNSWSERTRVQDAVHKWGLGRNPYLYQLPEDIGGFPAGTVLLAVIAVRNDRTKTALDVYASMDNGGSFKYVSTVAVGGGMPTETQVGTEIWDTFIITYDHQLVLYYTDSTDPNHSMKIVYVTSQDGVQWTNPVESVVYDEPTWRPAMATVIQLPDNSWMMSYELNEYDGPEERHYAIYMRTAASPLDFDKSKGNRVIASNPKDPKPSGGPYITWTPTGGKQGAIVLSDSAKSNVWVSLDLGGTWIYTQSNAPQAYSRGLTTDRVSGLVFILSSGVLYGDNNEVTITTFDASAAMLN